MMEIERRKSEAAPLVEGLPSPKPLPLVNPSGDSGNGLGLTDSQKTQSSPQKPFWAFAVIAIYLLLMIAMWIYPISYMAFQDSELFYEPIGFIWVALIISQLALVFIPLRFATRRPSRRRSLWPTLIATGFLSGLLVLGASWSLLELFYLYDSPNIGLIIALATWILWPAVFWFASRHAEPQSFAFLLNRLIIKGGIIELLIAVPSHIIVRSRNECCAGILTFAGLCLGLGVMFVAFGPGVLLLYYRKIKAKQIPSLSTTPTQKLPWNFLCIFAVLSAILAVVIISI